MRLTIAHQTRYAYLTPVHASLQQLRLTPRTDGGQQLRHWQLKVPGELQAFTDTFGNHSHQLVIDVPHQEVLIEVAGEIETGLPSGETDATLPLAIYLRTTPFTEADAALHAFAQRFAGQPLSALMLAISDHMLYRQDITDVQATAARAFQLGQGSCQDHTHLMLACCRSLGLPVRYVSGYLFSTDGSLHQAHTWVEVWQHPHWLGLDVCKRMPVDERYVRLAIGLDHRDASPVSASGIGGSEAHLTSLVHGNQPGRIETLARTWPETSPLSAQAAQQQQ